MKWPSARVVTLGVAAAVVVAAAAAAVFVWLIGLVTWESHTGYFGPAFSRDGRSIYVVTRQARAVTWGFGWEHFSPPAYAYPVTDGVALLRVDVATGDAETLESWATTPGLRRVIREYRGRVLNTMSAVVRPQPDGAVHYTIEMSIPRVPMSDVHTLAGVWTTVPTARRRGDWQPTGSAFAGVSEPVVTGDAEVFALHGPEYFPCAVVLLDHRTMATRTLRGEAACRRRYPDGPPLQALMDVSRKSDLDRIAEMTRVRDERVAHYRAQGRSEIEALLGANRDLEDRGHLPKSRRIVAERLASPEAGLPLFEIADAEMASGIFHDLERALATPGAEIDKSMGSYVTHRDYTTSARLNDLLARGEREFLVRYRGSTYRVEVRN